MDGGSLRSFVSDLTSLAAARPTANENLNDGGKTLTRFRFSSWLGLVATTLLMFLPAATPAPASGTPCDPGSDEVGSALVDLGLDWIHPTQIGTSEDPCSPGSECWLRWLERVTQLLERHPDDFLVRRLHQDLVWQQLPHGRNLSADDERRIDAARETYRRDANAAEASAADHYLWARVDPDRDDRNQHLERALEISSDFPWPHLDLAMSAAARNQPDQALRHLMEFRDLCPDRFSEILFYRWRFWLWKPDVFAIDPSELARIRALVEAAPPAYRVRDLPVLWPLEFSVVPVSEHEVVRERIRDDLASIEREQPGTSETDFLTWRTLHEGHGMLGKSDGADRAAETLLASYPCSHPAVQLRQERWDRDHPKAAESSVELARAQYEAAVEWTRICPEEYSFRSRRFRSFVALPVPESERLVDESNALLRVTDLYLDRHRYRMESPYREVANALIDHRVRPDLALEHLERETDLWRRLFHEEPVVEFPADLPEGEIVRTVGRHSRWLHHEISTARALVQTGDLDRSSEILDSVRNAIDEVQERSGDSPPAFLSDLEDAWYLARGDLSVARHELLDALAYYRDVNGEAARKIWGSLGGSPGGWAAWNAKPPIEKSVTASAPKAPATSTPVTKQAPTVGSGDLVVPAGWETIDAEINWSELTDLKGRRWNIDDFRGKTTFVNFWATWCMPCRPEFPVLNDLYRKTKGHSGIQIVSISTDANTGVVAPFTSRFELSYPVIPAPEFSRRNGIDSIPTNWVIGPDGSVLFRTSGSAVVEPGWVETTIAFLESLSAVGTTE